MYSGGETKTSHRFCTNSADGPEGKSLVFRTVRLVQLAISRVVWPLLAVAVRKSDEAATDTQIRTVARRQVGAPRAVGEALDGARRRVVEQHVADVAPERDGRVVRVVVRVDSLVRPVRYRRT